MARLLGRGQTGSKENVIERDKSRTAIQKAWRVIAPFVVARKSISPDKEDEQFSFYLKKRPEVLLSDLSTFMSDSVGLPSLFHETADVLQKVTKATWVVLYIVDNVTNEIFLSTAKPVEERFKVKWKTDVPSTVAAYVATKKEYVVIEDILLDMRFPEGVGYDVSSSAKAVMCIPIVTPDGTCSAVMEFVRTINRKPFNQDDLRICVIVTAWMGVAIHQNQERLALKRQQELNDYLLDLMRCYFEDRVLMEKLMSEVVKFAKVTLGAERGSFFVLDQDGEEMVAHLFDEDEGESKMKKVRFSTERGIAGLVAKTGVTVNIKDAYKDSRFYNEIDQKTGFITRSILCMPIASESGILGVVQVVNKKNGGCFSTADENLFKTFSLYCALAVHYTKIHDGIQKEKCLNAINLRTLKVQERPCSHDYTFLSQRRVEIPDNFDQFKWYFQNDEELMFAPHYALHMILDLIDVKEVNVDDLMTFILTVRKFYRDNPYHNFEHGFIVCHCMYVILKKNRWKFTKLEIKALLIASLCHDLDHVGLTNAYLEMVHHDLACLYDDSALEHHHVKIAFMLLQGLNIFPHLTDDARQMFHNEIEKAILATDLAKYFRARHTLLKIYHAKTFRWAQPKHRSLIKGVMMTSCDLSGMSKPFLTAKRICDNLYREFYRQGDLEKELGICPLSVMDRAKENLIPEDQVWFINIIVLPCLDLLRLVLPNTTELYSGAIELRGTWQDIIDMRGSKVWRQDDSIVKL